MNMKKIILVVSGALILIAGLAIVEKKSGNKDKESSMPHASAQQIIQVAKATIAIKDQSSLSNKDIENKIEDIERVLESSNAIERMNDETLDLETRQQFVDWIETKQKLLSILIDREIKSSQELLESRK